MILGPDRDFIGRKVFDLKITQTFPIITTESGKTKLKTKKEEIDIKEYQHLSIPPDLNLHLTKSIGDKRHLSFYIDLVNHNNGTLKEDLVHLFTWCSRQISNYRKPIGTWEQAQIIFPSKDNKFTENTGIFIDFFVHKRPEETQLIQHYPYLFESMRFAGVNHRNLSGPYQFNEIVRGKHRVISNYLFTIRFGYYETESDCAILNIPFSIKQTE